MPGLFLAIKQASRLSTATELSLSCRKLSLASQFRRLSMELHRD